MLKQQREESDRKIEDVGWYINYFHCMENRDACDITLMRLLNGAATTEVLYASIAGIAGVGAGTLMGLKIFKKLDLTALYRFVYLFMAAMGIFIFLTA